ncbi:MULTISPECIES: porin [Bradyrhizobium]|uniref:Porin n=2 Tax=Bradyrhizobium TaxID=374 RepID=A0ABY0QEE6_9BRAD|nr:MULTISPECIES: porin [Bradyrhizobium]SDK04580.1 Porin subfamily protein [Bradyrhizobium ottawaense]SEB85402.1 Porin subfamily protein [Bradyrhizobium lablabi]
MKMVKSLILGSAAGLIAMSGAQAADLPVKAKAVEYVRICSLYGAGFFYIPGTDTCIKLGGYVRIDTTFNGSTYGQAAWNGDLGQQNRYRDYFASRSRMALTVDTRTATEYGVVRTFGQADFQFNNLGGSTANPAVLGAPGVNSNLLSTPGGGYVAVEMVFIQFAGFTFGKSASAYATPWHGYPGNNNSYLLGGHDTVTGVNNIQYTAQFGNGVSATIGLDDPTVFNRTVVGNLSVGLPVAGSGVPVNAYGGTHAPDIVGNIRVDQAWGLFQVSGAAHLVNASYNVLGAGAAPTALSEINGHPDDKWGGSVMAALQIKNIPTGAGDDLKIDVSYAKGDTKNVISTSAGSPQFAMFGGTGVAGAYQSVGYGVTTDAIYSGGVGGGATQGLKLTTAWGIRGAFNHNWDPYWSSSLFGSYSQVMYDGNVLDPTSAKGAFCNAYNAATGVKSADYSCNPNFNVAQIGVVTRWTPVKNLTFSAEVGAFFLDQKFTGTNTLVAAPPKPIAVYEYKDQSTVYLNVRAQRNF